MKAHIHRQGVKRVKESAGLISPQVCTNFLKKFSNFESENFENEFNLIRFSLVLIQNGLI